MKAKKLDAGTTYRELVEDVIRKAGENGISRTEVCKKLDLSLVAMTQAISSSCCIYEETIKGQVYYFYHKW